MAGHNERFETPMMLLNECVEAEASGELVALDRLEAHVFVCSKRSLAEPPVAWGVGNTGQIREAVRTQIAAALESLRLALAARFLFLRHSFSHSTEITFALSEVLGHQSHHPLKKEEEQP